jgi:predicted phage gp36 major capsid-like protein
VVNSVNTEEGQDRPDKIKDKEGELSYDKLSDKCKQLQRFGWSQVQQVKELTRCNTIMKNNISSLYKTARAELDRKDAEIARLREQLDQILFRKQSVHQQTRDNRRPSTTNREPNSKHDYN